MKTYLIASLRHQTVLPRDIRPTVHGLCPVPLQSQDRYPRSEAAASLGIAVILEIAVVRGSIGKAETLGVPEIARILEMLETPGAPEISGIPEILKVAPIVETAAKLEILETPERRGSIVKAKAPEALENIVVAEILESLLITQGHHGIDPALDRDRDRIPDRGAILGPAVVINGFE